MRVIESPVLRKHCLSYCFLNSVGVLCSTSPKLQKSFGEDARNTECAVLRLLAQDREQVRWEALQRAADEHIGELCWLGGPDSEDEW